MIVRKETNLTEKIKSKTLFQSEIETIISSEESNKELAHRYNVSKRTIQRVKAGLIDGIEDEDYQLCDESIKMKYQLQRSREANQRINKTNRETFRIADLIQTMTDEFIEVVENSKHHNFTTKIHPNKTNEIGVIQLSDLHFGERVTEVNGNEFNFEVASKRLQKLADKSTQMFKSRGITSIVLACTGDLINSDRRLDEVTSNANNRAKVIYTAVEILKQLIQHLNQEFNVTVATVCGNESRINKDLGWVDFMAFDNFDAVIHMFLEFIFKDKEGVTVLPMKDPLEMVIDINGHNLCLIHGHNGLASDSACESKVTQLRAKYAAQNVRIDYVIFGHIHCSRISDLFARSSSIVGGNAYSDKALGFTSRAAQNIYIFDVDGIDGIKIDLQKYDYYKGYDFDKSNDVYMKQNDKSNIIIQKVIK